MPADNTNTYLRYVVETKSPVPPFTSYLPVSSLADADRLKAKLTRQNSEFIWYKDFAVVDHTKNHVIKLYRKNHKVNSVASVQPGKRLN